MTSKPANDPIYKSKKRPKSEIKYEVTLDEDQKLVKQSIWENQVTIVTGRAGSGKSLVCVIGAIDLLFNKEIEKINVTRAAIETGKSLGYLPGDLDEKFNPYLEAFMENVEKSVSLEKRKNLKDKIAATPIQFIRGKTIDGLLVVEEAQNLSKHEVLAILTRLGKNGRIVFNGDLDQKDIKDYDGEENGLKYLYELSKNIEEIKLIKLKTQHRSDLVGKILDHEYNK